MSAPTWVSTLGGVSAPGGSALWGYLLWGGGLWEVSAPEVYTPRTEFLTHACEKHYLSATSFAGGKNVCRLCASPVSLIFQWVWL